MIKFKHELGQYMTPMNIANQMVNLLANQIDNMIVLDPACGNGNLLLAVAELMKENGVKDIHKRLIGIDIDKEILNSAKLRLMKALNVEANELVLINDDFLNMKENTLKILKKMQINTVISNPPYGKLKEYEFFNKSNRLFDDKTNLVFLVPMAFMDRMKNIDYQVLPGRPLGVTTGHIILTHQVGKKYQFKSTRGMQQNSTNFEVFSGVKLYEVGAGNPPQSKEVVSIKPFSSEKMIEGWIPCLRTGDIYQYGYNIGRLFVDYGEHLAQPKNPKIFEGPKIFIRRMPLYKEGLLAATYCNKFILVAGDVLVIKHNTDDEVLLKGLEVFLNSPEAAKLMSEIRPTISTRVSYPKFSAKDVNKLLEFHCPSDLELRSLYERQIKHER